VALSSGVAYAANTIFSEDIVNGEVRTADIHGSAVTNGKLAANSVTGNKVANGTLTSGDLAGNSVANGKIQPNAVTSSKVRDDTLTNGGLAAIDLAANSVGASEIATNGVGASEIANNAIDAGEVEDFGLTNQDIGVLFAEVNANGTLANSSGGGVTSLKIGTGNYEVDFSRNVTACTAVATVGPAGGGSSSGEINVADRGGNAEAVFVATDTSAGASADRPFRLVVVC
jgi:hypothetical protein